MALQTCEVKWRVIMQGLRRASQGSKKRPIALINYEVVFANAINNLINLNNYC